MILFPSPIDSIRLEYRARGVAASPAPVVSISVGLVAATGTDDAVGPRSYTGRFTALGKVFTVRSEEAAGRPTRCEIDGSTFEWAAQTKLGWTRYVVEADLKAGPRVGHVTLVRVGLPTALTVFPDYGYAGKARIDGRAFTAVVAGDLGPDAKVWIDRNGDGRRQSQAEVVTVGAPFDFSGVTHELRLGPGGLAVVRSARSVPRVPDAPDLRVGRRMPALWLRTRSNETVRLPDSYRGKLVLLDLWASWCPPCVEALPTIARAYASLHGKGLEVVGVDLDEAGALAGADALGRSRGIVWTEVADGKGWANPIVGRLGVEEIPKLLLVDGDTGRIVATEAEMTAGGIEATLASAVRAKGASPRP